MTRKDSLLDMVRARPVFALVISLYRVSPLLDDGLATLLCRP
jgi:hypothetical protein